MPPAEPFSFESTDHALDAARTHARNGRLAEAESLYRNVLAEHPEQVEALRFAANATLARGNVSEAVALLSRAAQADRSDVGVLLDLALAYRNGQRPDEARSVLELALELSHGSNTTARLMLASILELDQRPAVALLNYLRAILDAQTAGHWLDDATTEPGLRNTVLHAMQYVAAGRRKLFEDALAPQRRNTDAALLERIDAALAVYLQEQPPPPASADQRPSFLYLHGLGAHPFLDPAALAWLDAWRGKVVLLDAEARACLDRTTPTAATPVFTLTAMTAGANQAATQADAQWAILSQHGSVQDTATRDAPQMHALLEAAPTVRIDSYAPDTVLMELPPATHTSPRHGRTNAFCTVIANFSGSAPLQVTVGRETRRLEASAALVFDPSFGFAFANEGNEPARALVFEVWNPGVSETERAAIATLAITATAFDRQLQELA